MTPVRIIAVVVLTLAAVVAAVLYALGRFFGEEENGRL